MLISYTAGHRIYLVVYQNNNTIFARFKQLYRTDEKKKKRIILRQYTCNISVVRRKSSVKQIETCFKEDLLLHSAR